MVPASRLGPRYYCIRQPTATEGRAHRAVQSRVRQLLTLTHEPAKSEWCACDDALVRSSAFVHVCTRPLGLPREAFLPNRLLLDLTRTTL